MALLRHRTVPFGIPLAAHKRTYSGNTRKTEFDPKATSPLSPPSYPSRASKVSPAVWTRTSRRDKLRAGYRNRERCEAAWVAAGSKTMNELTRRRLFQAAIVTVFFGTWTRISPAAEDAKL